MESIEDKLKKIIIEKYGSLKKFAAEIEMPYTTLDSIFKRGLKKCASYNLVKIVSALEINVSLLILEDKIVPFYAPNKLAQSLEWQERLANNARLTLEVKESLTGMFQILKEIIISNDKNDIFTGIPEEELLFHFWNLNDKEQNEFLQKLQNIPIEFNETTINTVVKIDRQHPRNRAIHKLMNKEELAPEEQQALDTFIQSGEFQRAFDSFSDSMKKLADNLREYYELLNEEGQKKADKHIEYAADQIEFLTKIPEYRKDNK